MTGGIAHGTSASTRATPRNRSGWLSSSASPSAEQELQDRDAERPHQPDPERAPEQVVVEQLLVVLQAGEAGVDVAAGAGVGEAEVDAAQQREHRQHDDRQRARGAAAGRWSPGRSGPGPGGARSASPRGRAASVERASRAAAARGRTTRCGGTVSRRGGRSGRRSARAGARAATRAAGRRTRARRWRAGGTTSARARCRPCRPAPRPAAPATPATSSACRAPTAIRSLAHTQRVRLAPRQQPLGRAPPGVRTGSRRPRSGSRRRRCRARQGRRGSRRRGRRPGTVSSGPLTKPMRRLPLRHQVVDRERDAGARVGAHVVDRHVRRAAGRSRRPGPDVAAIASMWASVTRIGEMIIPST